MDSPYGVRGLPTAPRPMPNGLTRFACQTAVEIETKKRWGNPSSEVPTPRPSQTPIIWPSCLEEFGWPQVGEFEVAIGADRLTTYVSRSFTLIRLIILQRELQVPKLVAR